jgi:acetyl esterase/lipase
MSANFFEQRRRAQNATKATLVFLCIFAESSPFQWVSARSKLFPDFAAIIHKRGRFEMRFFLTIILFFSVIFVNTSQAQSGSASDISKQLPSYVEVPSDAAGIFAIWPGSGVAPGSEKWTWHEQTMIVPGGVRPNHMVRNVAMPTVTMFKPDASRANSTTLIVAPGGAFRFLTIDSEGYDVARSLTAVGVTVFVLKYRLAHSPTNDAEMPVYMRAVFKTLTPPGSAEETPPVDGPETKEARAWAEEDGRQAIRFVREHAQEFGIDPNRIGIMGFSAGGGVTMAAVMQHDDKSRPDFAAGIYPAYRTATPVPADAPPLFIAAANDDMLVAPISGARLYEAWHAAGKPAELHIFSKGRHGFGMKKQNLPSDFWMELFKNWLADLGYLSQSGK